MTRSLVDYFLIFGVLITVFPKFIRGKFNQKLEFTKCGLLLSKIDRRTRRDVDTNSAIRKGRRDNYLVFIYRLSRFHIMQTIISGVCSWDIERSKGGNCKGENLLDVLLGGVPILTWLSLRRVRLYSAVSNEHCLNEVYKQHF